MTTQNPDPKISDFDTASVVGDKLSLAAFNQLSGCLAGIPFVKLVYDRVENKMHFINNSAYQAKKYF